MSMPTTTTTEISFDLDRGERLLWSGVPQQGIVFRSSDVFLIPFSLMWGGFALFWEFGVLSSPAPGFMAVWGVPFVFIGLYITVGRFFVDARIRRRTTYGVTTDRVIIADGLIAPRLKSLNLSTLTDVTLKQGADGRGTITFGPEIPWGRAYDGFAWPGIPRGTAFERIPEAKRVYDIVRDAQRGSRTAPPRSAP